MNKTITFGIPCYNSAAYMDHCIESILEGTGYAEDVEIIIVDDGSAKDETPAKADEWAERHPKIIRAIHQENGGHGAAVMQAVRNASGVYFKNVDSDDWVDAEAVSALLAQLRHFIELGEHVDLVITNYVYEHVEDDTRNVVDYRHVLPRGRFRAEYRLYAYTFPTEFYGMGVDACDADANRTDYRRVKLEAQGRFLVRVARNLYVGPVAGFRYVDASRVAPAGLPLFGGQPLRGLTALSAGLSLTYDTRDFMTNAYRGWLVQLDQTSTPAALADGFGYATTELTTSTYRQVWRGGVLAGELHACLNYGNPAWCMMAEVGSGSRMRGYYEGRYRDKHIVEMQVELRQRIWRRHGAALWVGAAQVFARPADVRWRRVLPNAGLGYRWEFRNRVNVRVDYGFTRNGGGFLFSLNEAF